MQQEDILTHCLNSEVSQNDGRIDTYYERENFKQSKLFNSPENSIQIMLYHDDFNVANRVGNKLSKYKKSAFCFVIGNVRSKLKDINLLLLSPASYITKYGYNEILQPCLDDFKIFEAIDISVKFENSNHFFKGFISMIIADNLVVHALGGFFCSFSMVNRFCRFRNCSKEQQERNAPLAEMQLRTLEAYNNNIRIEEADNSFTSVYGIKERSCLNDLEYIHVINGLPPDLGHDVFEGIAINIFSDIVGYFCKEKIIRLKEINDKISLFKFFELD